MLEDQESVGLERTGRSNHVGEPRERERQQRTKNSTEHVRRHCNQKEGLLRKGAYHLFFTEDQSKGKVLKFQVMQVRQKERLSGRTHSSLALEGEVMASFKAALPTGYLRGDSLAGPIHPPPTLQRLHIPPCSNTNPSSGLRIKVNC